MPSITSSAACLKIMLLAAILQLLLMLLLVVLKQADALRMINLDAPELALLGDTIQLDCFFSLQDTDSNHEKADRQIWAGQNSKLSSQQRNKIGPEVGKHEVEASGEQVYAVKWYKDEREFFRYLAQDWPRKQSFSTDGIKVDVSRSSVQKSLYSRSDFP